MKKVGVVIPIYNVEKYLKECLDSVINQTYTNLEIILVNDGSTDENSLNIAKEYTLKDKRITLFDKKNGGLSSARNVGIEYFSGEYKLKNKTQIIKENSLIEFNIEGNNPYEIYTVYKSYKAFNDEQDLTSFTYPIIDYIIFLDSDDYWELNCIEECVPRMDGVDVVWFDSKKIYCNMEKPKIEAITILQKYNFIKSCKITQKEWLEKTLKYNMQSFWFGWHGMINFDFLKNIKLKFFDYIVHEDNHFGPLLFFCSQNIYVMLDKIYIHRMRPNSIMDYRQLDIISTPQFVNDFFSFLDTQNAYEVKMIHRYVSLFLIAFDLLNFIRNTEIPNKYLFYKIFSPRLKQWQMSLMETPYKKEIIAKIISQIYKKQTNIVFYKEYIELYQELILQKNTHIQNLTDALVKNKELILQKNTRIQNLTDALVKNKELILQKNTHIQNLTDALVKNKELILQKNTRIQNLTDALVKNKELILQKNTHIQNLNNTLVEITKEKDQCILNKDNLINNQADKIKFLQKNIKENSTQLNQIQTKLSFQTKYGTAKTRIQNQLSYKLGQAMIVNSKSILGYIRMPFVLSYIKDKHKQEQKNYQEKIKKDPSLKLPSLEDYPDYQEALKEKECLTYKLGEALIKANKTWYKGGYVKMWFEIGKLKREFKENGGRDCE